MTIDVHHMAGLGGWSRLQLAAPVMVSFRVLKPATVIAGCGIVAYGLGEQASGRRAVAISAGKPHRPMLGCAA